MINFICFLFNHKIPEAYSEFIHLGCIRWDNCDIKEHQMVDMVYKCERCNFKITKRVRLYEHHSRPTLATRCDQE